MQLLRQKGSTCFITSLAMCLGVPVEAIINHIGHDGQDRIWPFVGSRGFRGVHPQELLDVCIYFKHWLVEVDPDPYIGQTEEYNRPVYGDPEKRFYNILRGNRGILSLGRHAVAFDEDGNTYDPSGGIKSLHDYPIGLAWLVVKM